MSKIKINKKTIEAAGKLAIAAHAVLRGEDDALGQLRRAVNKYDHHIIEETQNESVRTKKTDSRRAKRS